jgi:membrane-bound lytic murein transglycosylase MltF
LKLHIVIVPTTRDRLIQDLIEGRGDIAASNLTITAARETQIEFTAPFVRGVDEIVVTGPDAPALSSLQDLSGKQVFIRRSSSYWRSLERLNEQLARSGRPKVKLVAADEILETEDILEMLNAGLVPITIADDYLAAYWGQVYDGITLHPALVVRSGAEIAWAIRKDSPKLRAVLDEFMRKHKQGTLIGNLLIHRYWRNAKGVKDSLGKDEMARFRETTAYFQKYARMYDLDWRMLTAQAYQESGLDHRARSPAGAVGVMQILPSTARDPNVGIPEIDELESNIQAGAKYLRFLIDRYFDEDGVDPLNRSLFALAAYNAGPGRIARLRQKAAQKGLDPNVWFRNVEVVAAHDIGRETVQYVSNIYKYYVSYRLMTEQQLRKRALRSG